MERKEVRFWSAQNLISLALLAVLIFAFRWSVASPYHVPTGSMEPTIKVGDRLLSWKLSYMLKFPFTDWIVASWSTPKHNDIIIFPCLNDPSFDCVKRVVGTEDDEIRLIDNVLFLNGEPQVRTEHDFDRKILEDIHDPKDERSLYQENLKGTQHWVMVNKAHAMPSQVSTWPDQTSPQYKVPKGHVFVMGDNRDNSMDARFWGPVPVQMVKGQTLFVLWSMYFPRKSSGDGDEWLPVFRFYRSGDWLK